MAIPQFDGGTGLGPVLKLYLQSIRYFILKFHMSYLGDSGVVGMASLLLYTLIVTDFGNPNFSPFLHSFLDGEKLDEDFTGTYNTFKGVFVRDFLIGLHCLVGRFIAHVPKELQFVSEHRLI